VVVAAGRRSAPVARWIREQTLGRTRLVQLGRRGAEVADCFDAVVSPAYAHLWPHPRRIETTALLTRSTPKRLARADDGLRVELAEAPRPLVVPGDDELLLSEAAASGKPVYVAALPQRSPGPVEPLRKWVSRRAHSRPANRRGTARPQQGLEYLCARLIDRGIVSPPLDLGELHRELYRRRIALPLGVPLETGPRPALSEADPVALRVRILLGYTGVDERSEPSVA
jgi:hypothetical protein